MKHETWVLALMVSTLAPFFVTVVAQDNEFYVGFGVSDYNAVATLNLTENTVGEYSVARLYNTGDFNLTVISTWMPDTIFGNMETGNYSSKKRNNVLSASKFTLPEDGIILSMSWYGARNRVNQNLSMAIYADENGEPRNLVAYTENVTVNSIVPQWWTADITWGNKLTAGDYWLAFLHDGKNNANLTYYFDDRLDSETDRLEVNYTEGFPDPFGGPWKEIPSPTPLTWKFMHYNRSICIYATYTSIQVEFTPNPLFMQTDTITLIEAKITAWQTCNSSGIVDFDCEVHLPINYTGNPSKPGGSAHARFIVVGTVSPSPEQPEVGPETPAPAPPFNWAPLLIVAGLSSAIGILAIARRWVKKK